MSDVADGDMMNAGQTGADCEYDEPYKLATITFRRGYGREEYKEFVMHELLHLSFAHCHTAALLVAEIASEQQAPLSWDIGKRMVDDGIERSITPLARSLVRMIKPTKLEV
jgi:hypothetical protein